MPRNYIRKTDKANYDKCKLQEAVEAVKTIQDPPLLHTSTVKEGKNRKQWLEA